MICEGQWNFGMTTLSASFLIASKGDDNEVKKECAPV